MPFPISSQVPLTTQPPFRTDHLNILRQKERGKLIWNFRDFNNGNYTCSTAAAEPSCKRESRMPVLSPQE